MMSKTVCICGGGNIAHAMAVVLSRDSRVMVYTRNPSAWSRHISYRMGEDATERHSCHEIIATDDVNVVGGVDYVFVTLPRFAVRELLGKVNPVLRKNQIVMFCPAPSGMEVLVADYSRRGINTVGFQRVPYVARIREYGKSVWIGDVRAKTCLAYSQKEIIPEVEEFVKSRIGGQVSRLASFLSCTFSNSNPLLHPVRLVALLKGGINGCYSKCPLFYADWTDEASEMYVKADEEMFRVFKCYSPEAAQCDYESALSHYESKTPEQLTRKIRSIESLRRILAPWKLGEDGLWYPDFDSRYFTEDIPYGTAVIQEYARRVNIAVPTIDYLIDFIGKRMNGRARQSCTAD